MGLPTDSQERKNTPVWSGFVVYFANAMVAVAQLSKWSDRKHNPEKPLDTAPTWAKHKSADEEDAGMRHAMEPLLIGGDTYDPEDGFAHKVKKAWRAMADLERFLLAGNPARAFVPGPGGIRIPCAGYPMPEMPCTCPPGERPCKCQKKYALSECLAAFSKPLDEIAFNRCLECDRPAPNHAPNCSKNFPHLRAGQAPTPKQPDETLYATGADLAKPGADKTVVPAVFCPQCGCEAPRHFAGCLSRAANGGQ